MKKEIELFNQTINYFKVHHKNLLKCFLVSSAVLVVAVLVFNFLLPSSFFESLLYNDLRNSIYKTSSYLGFNPYYYITIISLFGFLLQLFVSLNITSSQKVQSVFNFNQLLDVAKTKVLSYFVLYVLMLAIVWGISQFLIVLDLEFYDYFSFSLFKLIYVAIPIILYFIVAKQYNNLTSDISITESFKKIKTHLPIKNVWLSTVFILIIYALVKYIVKSVIYVFIALLAFLNIFPAQLMDLMLILSDAFLIYFIVMFITFLYSNIPQTSRDLEIKQLINEIE